MARAGRPPAARRVPFLGHWVSGVEGRGTIRGGCVTPCHKVDLVGGDRVGRRDGRDLLSFSPSAPARFSSSLPCVMLSHAAFPSSVTQINIII